MLTFDYLKAGARAYIAVSGGIDVPVVLGSRSTYPLGALGGFEGRALQAGDELPIGGVRRRRRRGRSRARGAAPDLPSELEIRVLLGLYGTGSPTTAGATFFADTWKVAPDADRIGYRFKGGRRSTSSSASSRSARAPTRRTSSTRCYPIGSIQVPGGIEPIVLHRDAVSGGGYAMIGTVISADMDTVAQSAPGSKTRFVPVDLEAALAARRERAERHSRLEEALGAGG